MIKTRLLNDDTLIQHYSDIGMLLLQNETGIMYNDPVDINPCPYTYTETTILAESGEDVGGEDEEISSEEFYAMIEGVL